MSAKDLFINSFVVFSFAIWLPMILIPIVLILTLFKLKEQAKLRKNYSTITPPISLIAQLSESPILLTLPPANRMCRCSRPKRTMHRGHADSAGRGEGGTEAM